MATLPGETYRLAFPTLKDQESPAYVSYGCSHHETAAHHVKNTFQANKAYIIASASLSKNTDEVEKLKQALGARFAGVWNGIAPHTPWDEVVGATNDALANKADCLITIGGGSLVDGAKAMLLFMANQITKVEDVLPFAQKLAFGQDNMNRKSSQLNCIAPTIPLICIPTTLSGGEYTNFAGGTDPETHHKLVMGHPFCGPRLIINDPALTITAPEWVWLSTGVRGIDHCVEAYCRTHQPDEEVDENALQGFKLIVPNLLRTKKDWKNEEARLRCMLGVNAVTIMLKKSALPGASHGIGHQLGPLGVGHGQTSCILLPAVMKYNYKANAEKQEKLRKFMWSEPDVVQVLKARGLDEASSDAGDALDAIFKELGMPRSLEEVGVRRDKFEALAVNSLRDPCCVVNPTPLKRKEQVMEILEMCAT